MEPKTKCHFYMDGVFGVLDTPTSTTKTGRLFSYDSEYHDPREMLTVSLSITHPQTHTYTPS
jgi:hypothetical protein